MENSKQVVIIIQIDTSTIPESATMQDIVISERFLNSMPRGSIQRNRGVTLGLKVCELAKLLYCL